MSDRPRDRLWRRITPVYDAILAHPFLDGLCDGSLPLDAFRRYVVQDVLFLQDYSRALALCGARAIDTAQLRMFCSHAAEAIDVERELHDRLAERLGIAPRDLAAAEMTPTTLGYTAFLLQAAGLRDLPVALGAIVPCYWIYWRVGQALAERGSPDERYRLWIDTYADDQFGDAVAAVLDAYDRRLAEASPALMRHSTDGALTAARYEWMFWNAALLDERWPIGVGAPTGGSDS